MKNLFLLLFVTFAVNVFARSADQVYIMPHTGNVPVWGQVDLAQLAAVKNALPIANGGTNNAALAVTNGGLLYTDGSKVMNSGAGSSGQILQSAGAASPTWTTTLTIAQGGTNNGSLGVDAGGVYYSDGTKLVNLAHGTSGTVLTSGGTSAPTWAGASSAYTYTSQTTTYTASINDFVSASSTSFTITLPTAVGQSGKGIVIRHNGTSLSQVYTLNTTSSQTISGIASGSYALYTNGEVVTVVSDGTNWQVVAHKANASGSYTANYSSAFGTSITGACYWDRTGNMMDVRCTSTLGTLANAVNATISLPGNATIDSSRVLNNGSGSPGSLVGSITNNGGNAGEYAVLVTAPASNNTVVYVGNNVGSTSIPTPTTGYASVGGNNSVFSAATFRVPISGWQP